MSLTSAIVGGAALPMPPAMEPGGAEAGPALPQTAALQLPDSENVDRLAASLHASSGEFAALLRRYGAPSPALRHYGLIQWLNGRPAAAIEAFRAALALKPEDADLWRDLAGAFDASGDIVLAEYCVRESLRHQPGNARAWLLFANFANRAHRRDEAEEAFCNAITLDPSLGDAHFGLGLLRFEQRRLDAAVASLRLAIANGYANALGLSTLGHVQYVAADFAGCVAAFESAARLAPLDQNGRRKYARARTLQAMIDGDVTQAVAAFPALIGEDREDGSDFFLEAFSLLSAYGHHEAAAALGRLRLAENPDDPIRQYLLDAVLDRPLSRAPVDYLETYFDLFAKSFDRKLVDVLQYDAPSLMARLVAQSRSRFDETLDLGCGTGLAAAHLAPFGGRLTGVDVSGRMLDEAARRSLYARLEKAEAIEFLARRGALFDLVFAADVLVYLGDLEPLFAAVAQSIAPAGIFAVSIETTLAGDYKLLPSGRFAHAVAYLERLAAADFEIIATQEATIRLEAARPARGMLFVFKRRQA